MAANSNDRKSFFKRIRNRESAPEGEMTFMGHIEALRWHIMRAAIVWLIAAIGIFVVKDWVYDHIILAPTFGDFITYTSFCRLSHWLGIGDSLCMPPVKISFQVTEVSGKFNSAINIAVVGAVVIVFPYLFWELWRFVKPALSPKELKYARGSIFWVSLCFFCGAAFGYYLLAPFTFNFLATFDLGTRNAIDYRPTLTDYIDTLTSLVLYCGIAFELPVLAYVLARIGLISSKILKKFRKYAIVVILIVAAIITPSPDWYSQTIVAVPLIILYVIAEIITSRVDKKRAKKDKQEWS